MEYVDNWCIIVVHMLPVLEVLVCTNEHTHWCAGWPVFYLLCVRSGFQRSV